MLEGLKVLELASDRAALVGKLLGDLGAEVVVVEPPGGHPSRGYGPFADDEQHPDKSLWWWYYNTSKRSVEIDLHAVEGITYFERLVANSDIVVEAETPGYLAERSIDYLRFLARHPRLIWVSVTPYGRRCADLDAPMTDLTMLAGGGPIWSCGYDDHTLPPVRGGGTQGFHIASLFAAMSTLTAVLYRDTGGVGQHVDISMHAAANVTTEGATYNWMVGQRILQRQTGRHAAVAPTGELQVEAADGRYVNSGPPPRKPEHFQSVLDWMSELGILDEFPDRIFLEMGRDRGGLDPRDVGDDPELMEIFRAGREALSFISSRISAKEYFVGAQNRDFQCGIVYSPDEALEDEHFQARDFPVTVHHPELRRDIIYPGAPFKTSSTHGWAIHRRPPLVGEHTAELLD